MAKRKLSLRHVEAFRSVCETSSMTVAARQLHTSQPQISRLVSQLEEIVGFALFHRNGSRLSLSSEGRFFSADVDKTFAGLAALEASAARIRSFGASKLTLAAMPRLAGGLLARAVARFKQEFPDVLVSIQSGDSASVNSWITSGLCDVGLAMLYNEPDSLHSKSVAQLDCVVVLPASHPLAELPAISATDLDGVRFVAPPVSSPLRERLDSAFAAAKVRPLITAEASLGSSACALVAAGLGISVVNEWAVAEDFRESDRVAVRSFQPRIRSDVMLLYPEHREKSLLVKTFSSYAIETIRLEHQANALPRD